MSIKTLIETAQEKKYTEFEPKLKEIMAKKVATALDERGYFQRLDQAKGLFEAKGKWKLQKDGKEFFLLYKSPSYGDGEGLIFVWPENGEYAVTFSGDVGNSGNDSFEKNDLKRLPKYYKNDFDDPIPPVPMDLLAKTTELSDPDKSFEKFGY